MIGADFNGQGVEGNRGNKEVLGRYGTKERSAECRMTRNQEEGVSEGKDKD